MKHRIWDGGEGLTYSTISNIINDKKDNLRNLAMDVLDFHAEKEDKLEIARKAFEQAERDYNYAKSQIGSVLNIAIKRFDLREIVFVDSNKIYEIKEKEGSVFSKITDCSL